MFYGFVLLIEVFFVLTINGLHKFGLRCSIQIEFSFLSQENEVSFIIERKLLVLIFNAGSGYRSD